MPRRSCAASCAAAWAMAPPTCWPSRSCTRTARRSTGTPAGRAPVQPLSAPRPERAAAVLAGVERTLADIRRLGDTLASAGPREDMGVVGTFAAARRPRAGRVRSSSWWATGRSSSAGATRRRRPRAAAASPAAAAGRPAERARPVLEAPPSAPRCRRPAGRARSFPGRARSPPRCRCCSCCWAAPGCCASCLPADPDLALATREGPPAPPAPEPRARSDAGAEGRLLRPRKRARAC